MNNKDLYKHLKSLEIPHRDKNFSFVLAEETDKFDAVKNAIKDVKSNFNQVSEKVDKVEENLVKFKK